MHEITHTPDRDHLEERLSDPRRVLNATWLTKEEKRELLAFWLSDIHAVPNRPALRRLESGALLNVDDLSEALKALDEPEMLRGAKVIPFRRRSSPDRGPDHPAPGALRLRPLPPPVVTDARASAFSHLRRGLR
jgi:hypothetical protein